MPGHVIAVVGGKGGVGKSVFAANLAVSYMQNFKQRPLIVDLDLQSLGDQNLILGLNPEKSIVDVSKLPPGPIEARQLGPMMGVSPAGFNFISAPRDTIMARELDLEGLGRFLKAAPNIFPLTVLDVGQVSDLHALKALEYATAIFVVTTADVIVLSQTRRVLGKIQELMFPPEMVQIVVNRVAPTQVITPQTIQRNLNRSVFATIPEDVGTCDGSLAKGTPLCLAAPQSGIARAYHDLIRRVYQVRLLENLEKVKKPSGISAKAAQSGASQVVGQAGMPPAPGNSGNPNNSRSRAASMDPWTALKLRVHKALVERMDLKKVQGDPNDPAARAVLREKTQKVVLEILENEDTAVLNSREAKQNLMKEVLDEALGLGPLEDFLSDPSVTEIMVNARDQIYLERAGKPQVSKVTFSSEQQMMNVVERIVTPLGRRVDEKIPYVDARLIDGSRVHIIIPPLALRGPTITIRKFPSKRITVKDFAGFGTLTQEIGDFLRACVEARLNIIVSGGTGSGKTTMLNVLSNFIPTNERIITIEDAAELQLGQEHVVRLESRPKNIEGEGEVSIRDLVKCSLRMRPDRIVVGEVRDGAALDMLQAMNTGHDGSLTTLHANSPREALARLETLVMMADLGLPSKAIKETIASAVHLVVQMTRLSDGSRKVTYISEVTGMQGEVISMQDVFLFKQEGLDKNRKVLGRFVPTGFVPKFIEEMEAQGLKVPRSLFSSKAS